MHTHGHIPSAFSRFQFSYSGMVKKEWLRAAFPLPLLTLTMGVMNSSRKPGTLRSEGQKWSSMLMMRLWGSEGGGGDGRYVTGDMGV
jgi:hypothetical protein